MSYVIPRIVKWATAALIGFPLFSASAMALGANDAPETELSFCKYLKDATVVQSLRDLPPALRKAILTRMPLLADRGEAFSADCVRGTGESSERFIVAAQIGSRWAVAYEQGGFVHSAYVMAFDQQTDRYEIVSLRSSSLKEYCAEMNARLGNEPIPNDGGNFLISFETRREKIRGEAK
jgi:hypothetical protein